jgi:hypothetical protein
MLSTGGIERGNKMSYETELLKQLMWKLQNEHKEAFNELSMLPEGSLYQLKHNERTFYYHLVGKGKEKTKTGITKNTKLIYQLARKEYLLIAMNKQETGMKQIKKISAKMNFDSWHEAAEEASRKFPALATEIFFLGEQYEKRLNYSSPMFADNTIHRTQRGVKVRSKSELFIADMLEAQELPYQYEIELPYNEYHFCPDFTVIRPRDGKVIFWEHFGMTHDSEYLKKMDLKLEKYRNMGIRPWDNLIISYDKEDGSLDAGVIRSLIEGWLR